jgi:hypothetical protein
MFGRALDDIFRAIGLAGFPPAVSNPEPRRSAADLQAEIEIRAAREAAKTLTAISGDEMIKWLDTRA